MGGTPDQNSQGRIHDGADEDAASGSRLRIDHDRRNNHRHEDRAGKGEAGASQAAGPASLGEQITLRLKQQGITLSCLIVVMAIIALIRTFIIQNFTIPSGSMESTPDGGDRVTVTMYDSDKIHRGDVVVFTDPNHWLTTQKPTGLRGATQGFLVAIRIFPQNVGHHLIRRVVGMPGNHVVTDGEDSLTVNGVELHEGYLKPGRSAPEAALDVTVLEDCTWVMGGNRSNSSSPRYHQNDVHRGFMPLDNVVGMTEDVMWPYSHQSSLTSGQEVFSQVLKPTSTLTALPAGPVAPNPASTPAGSGD